MNIDWKPLIEIIQQNQSFVLTSHVRPDADALGSELAMLGILRALGKEVHIVNPGATGEHLKFLDPDGETKSLAEIGGAAVREADVHIILDTSAWKQITSVGEAMKKSDSKKVVIDHHVSSDNLGATDFKDTTSPATGCLVFEFGKAIGHTFTKIEAIQLYAAIATDTGWFRFPSTKPETLHIIGELMSLGADPADIYQKINEQRSLARIHLAGIALQRAELGGGGRIAYTWVTQDDFAKTKSHPSDTENLVNECLTITGTEGAFILVQQLNRQFKVSLRSRTTLDVSKIAEKFNGGGHRQASGAMVNVPLEEAIKLIRGAMEAALNKNDSSKNLETTTQ